MGFWRRQLVDAVSEGELKQWQRGRRGEEEDMKCPQAECLGLSTGWKWGENQRFGTGIKWHGGRDSRH